MVNEFPLTPAPLARGRGERLRDGLSSMEHLLFGSLNRFEH
jgi:hypothetical protein